MNENHTGDRRPTLMLGPRFWSKVNKTEYCWEWTGCRGNNGHWHGRFYYNGRMQQAHRLAWEEAHGPIPAGQHVLHKCDRPTCVRPDHLYLGTAADNMADMVLRGRCTNAKVTATEVAEIRRRSSTGATTKELLQRFNISKTQVQKIVKREAWKVVE